MRRLPFGLRRHLSAPEAFQKRNLEIFGDIDILVHIVLDDIIIAASNDNEHDETFRGVLERAREKTVKFNRIKIQYKVSEVHFLGRRLSGQGVRPSDKKIIDIRDMPTPQYRAELQRILGMKTYVSKFIPHFSAHTDPFVNYCARTLIGNRVTSMIARGAQRYCKRATYGFSHLRIQSSKSTTSVSTDAQVL